MSFFFFSSRRRHTRFKCDWSSDVCSSDLAGEPRFGGDNVGAVVGAAVRGQAADVDDRPAAGANQMRQTGLSAEKRAVEPRFGGDNVGAVVGAAVRGQAADVDDRPAAGANQMRQTGLSAEKRAV